MIQTSARGETTKNYFAEELMKVPNHSLKCSQSYPVPMAATKGDSSMKTRLNLAQSWWLQEALTLNRPNPCQTKNWRLHKLEILSIRTKKMRTKASKRVESKLILKMWKRICQIRAPERTQGQELVQAPEFNRSVPRSRVEMPSLWDRVRTARSVWAATSSKNRWKAKVPPPSMVIMMTQMSMLRMSSKIWLTDRLIMNHLNPSCLHLSRNLCLGG